MLTIVDLFYFIMCEDLHKYTFIEIVFGWGPSHIRLHTTLEDPWSHYIILEVSWVGLSTLSLGGSPNFMITALGLCAKCPLELVVALDGINSSSTKHDYLSWTKNLRNWHKSDLGEPTHTLIPCWMPKPLTPRNQYTGWFAPATQRWC